MSKFQKAKVTYIQLEFSELVPVVDSVIEINKIILNSMAHGTGRSMLQPQDLSNDS